MRDQNQIAKVPSPVRRGRGCLPWLGGSAALLLGLMLIRYLNEPRAEAADARAYPPPGQLVDVGGFRLHINCTGSGSPTVIIDAGLGDWSTGWEYVQTEVARTTRICTYDRAGWAWSEAGPLPRDAEHAAKELHTLLKNAKVPGPYVLVGHSLGGLIVRVFVHDYAPEVAGVVLIDSMTPQQFSQAPTDSAAPVPEQSRPLNFFVVLARLGIVRLLAKPLGIVPPAIPNSGAYFARAVRPQSLQALIDDSKGMAAAGAQASRVKSFGDLPLLILTARLNDISDWPEWQKELLQLSSNSQQLFAENSGHNIEFDEPEAAVKAILQMLQQIQGYSNDNGG